MVHWTKKPENREKLAKAAAKRARTRKKRGRRSAASAEVVRYGAKSNVISVIRNELRDAENRVKALRAILRRYQTLR
jgi:hypothetical protein